jgi:ABC-type phosphate transport system substrate-binding protein
VKALDINGIPISRLTILTDRYPISRSFYFVFYDKPNNAVIDINQGSFFDKIFSFLKIDDDKAHQIKIETVQSFLNFVKSKKGQEIIEKNGAIAVY